MRFHRVAAAVFAVVALAHLYRVLLAIPVQVGSTAVPEWVSCVAVAIAGTLSVWGFRTQD